MNHQLPPQAPELALNAEPSGRAASWLILPSLVAGALAGLLGSGFRLVLQRAEIFREEALSWAHHQLPVYGWLVPVFGVALSAGFARWLVRRFAPDASGSGVPQVEAVVRDNAPLGSLVALPVKFVGGAIVLGGGLLLGREGPTVQMGALAAQFVGTVLRLPRGAVRVLLAAGSGAGLAAAFSAPLSGAVFVLEEIAQRFSLRILVATLSACSASIAVSYQVLGMRPDFNIAHIAVPGFFHFIFYLGLGLPLGLLGVIYNSLILRGLDLTDRFKGARSDLVAAAIGGVVGLAEWLRSDLLGGGDYLVQQLMNGQVGYCTLATLFLVRFILGPASYAARVPGGIFAPLLVIGGAVGAASGLLVHALAPSLLRDPAAITLVGMAGFFAATVRAPITGIALVLELTGVTSLFVPLLATCSVAAAVPAALGAAPIYDALRERVEHVHAQV